MEKSKNILKSIVILGIILALAMPGAAGLTDTKTKSFSDSSIVTNIQPSKGPSTVNAAIFEDGFETYENFILDFPPWTQYDGDGGSTRGSLDYNFTNEYYNGSFIIFNASATEPPANGTSWDAHTGDKYAACFSTRPPDNPNYDWLINPELDIGGKKIYISIHCVSDDSFVFMLDDFSVNESGNDVEISFWAKSNTDQYGLERFQVGVSTTDNNISSFEIITPEPYVEAPTEWTEYTYNYELAAPKLEIGEIIGGLLGISAEIKNNGTCNATNVTYSIVLGGGTILMGQEISENIGTIEAGGTGAMFDIPVIGFGSVDITATVSADGVEEVTRIGKGFVLLFYIIITTC